MKRKKELSDCDSVQKAVCVIHMSTSTKTNFVYLSNSRLKEERFAKLLEIRDVRLEQPVTSAERMENECKQMPLSPEAHHGYHRDCYNRFVKNYDRIAVKSVIDSACEDGGGDAMPLRSNDNEFKDGIIFNPDCIFCNSMSKRKVKKGGTWTTEGLSNFEFNGGESIEEIAAKNGPEKLRRRIAGIDLFCKEAKYHPSCRKKFLRAKQDPQMGDATNVFQGEQIKMEEAHHVAFQAVQEIIDRDVVHEQKVVALSYLRNVYVEVLSKTDFRNVNYRSEKLKSKIRKVDRYQNLIEFASMTSSGQFSSYLVYSKMTPVDDLVRHSYQLGTADITQKAGLKANESIQRAYHSSSKMEWPPKTENLVNSNPVPLDIFKFLSYIIYGHSVDKTDEKRTRIVNSISQDICRAATNGKWKLPKHVALSMTVRHLFRSKELTTILNRLGHSENYSFASELETAIAISLEKESTLLSTEIVREPTGKSLFHSDFDNFDQYVNSLHGAGSVHTAHGIMLQEVDDDSSEILPDPKTVPRTKERSIALTTNTELPVCYMSHPKPPDIKIVRHFNVNDEACYNQSVIEDVAYFLLRMLASHDVQKLPSYSGFISKIGITPTKKTTLDYYPVIQQPITDYKTVQEVLRYSEEASHEVGQKKVITTFDMGVCMKAFPLTWTYPIKYSDHLIMIGTFHVEMTYLKYIGKKMSGSGLFDILPESGMIKAGSINGIVNGKSYYRAMNCHRAMSEALIRLLFERFVEVRGERKLLQSVDEKILQAFIDCQSRKAFEDILKNQQFSKYIMDFIVFLNEASNGSLGKTAQFWCQYLDKVWLVLSLIKAVKTNNFDSYRYVLMKMCDLFFAYDAQNYSRYLTFHALNMVNIEENHSGSEELLRRGAISVARSLMSGNRCAVDKSIEETFMKHAKSKGGMGGPGFGLSGLLKNPQAYQRWTKTMHERTKYTQVTLAMANMLKESIDGQTHKDLRPTQIKRSEKNVVSVLNSLEGFINPFTIEDNDHLYCISSGKYVSEDVERSLLLAETIGKESKEKFITERLEKKEVPWANPISKKKLKTFESGSKSAQVRKTNKQTIEYKQQGNIAFQLLVRAQLVDEKIDLSELMAFPLTPVPYSIGTADGMLLKTDKAKSMHHVTKNVPPAEAPPCENTLVVEDGNALFHCMKDIPTTFKDICDKLLKMIASKCPVIFSTDMYNKNSIKTTERERRGCGEKLIIKGYNTKRPRDWKLFLSNDENKQQLIQLICNTWRDDLFAKEIVNRDLTMICEGRAYKIYSNDGKTTESHEIDSLNSDQEETDSRIILYSKYAKDIGYDYVRIRTPDSDIFWILLYYAKDMLSGLNVIMDTGFGNKRQLINVSKIAEGYTKEQCTALLALHAYTRCDSTSAFKGIGKIKPMKILQKKPMFEDVLCALGEEWNMKNELVDQLEEFTCSLYGSKHKHLNDARTYILKLKCGTGKLNADANFHMGGLPPCRKVLEQHIRRVNYQVAIWKRAHIPYQTLPDPTEGHGWKISDGLIEPLWIDGAIMPESLADLIETTVKADEDTQNDDLNDISVSNGGDDDFDDDDENDNEDDDDEEDIQLE